MVAWRLVAISSPLVLSVVGAYSYSVSHKMQSHAARPLWGLSARRGGSLAGSVMTRMMSSTSNFGFPSPAEDVIKKAYTYRDVLVDVEPGQRVIPIELVSKPVFDKWLETQDARTRGFLKFKAEEGVVKHKDGAIEVIPKWDGVDSSDEAPSAMVDKVVMFTKAHVFQSSQPFAISSLPTSLPAGTYKLTDFENGTRLSDPTTAALSWAMGTYRIDRYREKPSKPLPKLVWPEGADRDRVGYTVAGTFIVRELVNMPTECLGPQQLQEAAELIGKEFGAEVNTIVGEDLLKENFPQIHTVGRAAAPGREPRLIDLRWGSADRPRITLVGKGVCYDTGGLDIKPSASMGGMKKDMGGGAQVLGLAWMIMAANLPVRLRVLVPAVENCVDGKSFRSGDILRARNGRTSEITNTDAEGRLVLVDALVEADAEDPDIIVDCATLTGASRVAVGMELQSMFSNKPELAKRLEKLSWQLDDPLVHMPLYRGYWKHLKSSLADQRSTGNGGSGVITAALYIERFLQKRNAPGAAGHKATPWVHIDFNGANGADRPGRPQGGDAQGMRALFSLITEIAERKGWPTGEGEAEEEDSSQA